MTSIKKYSFLLLLSSFALTCFGTGIRHSEPQNTIRFTENRNQWEKNVLYRAQLDGGVMFLEKNCFTYNFYDKETLRKNHITKPDAPRNPINSHAFRVTFTGASFTAIEGKQMTPDHCNFFIGKDRSKWAGNVRNFKEIVYDDIYKGIDLQLLGLQNSLKYNFFVAPGADADEIKMFYEGLESLSLEKGALKIKTTVNEMTEQHPYAFQWIGGQRVEVPCEFELKNNVVTFNFPRGYNKAFELVIDPILVFACSSGSTADNFGMTATYDSEGNLFSGGTCFNNGFPTTLGAFDATYNGIVASGRTDVVITKYDSSGTFLQYSTYLGGAGSTEVVSSLIVNAQNELMLYGVTGSVDFPVTPSAYDTTFNGGTYLNYAPNGTEYLN